MDVFNGLLLAPNLDAAFDRGFITFADNGGMVVSNRLAPSDRELLGLNQEQRIGMLTEKHCPYLVWHRQHVFR